MAVLIAPGFVCAQTTPVKYKVRLPDLSIMSSHATTYTLTDPDLYQQCVLVTVSSTDSSAETLLTTEGVPRLHMVRAKIRGRSERAILNERIEVLKDTYSTTQTAENWNALKAAMDEWDSKGY